MIILGKSFMVENHVIYYLSDMTEFQKKYYKCTDIKEKVCECCKWNEELNKPICFSERGNDNFIMKNCKYVATRNMDEKGNSFRDWLDDETYCMAKVKDDYND